MTTEPSVALRYRGTTIPIITEQCRLIEQQADGRWIAEIEMPDWNGKPWGKNGIRLLLDELEIAPPRRILLRRYAISRGLRR